MALDRISSRGERGNAQARPTRRHTLATRRAAVGLESGLGRRSRPSVSWRYGIVGAAVAALACVDPTKARTEGLQRPLTDAGAGEDLAKQAPKTRILKIYKFCFSADGPPVPQARLRGRGHSPSLPPASRSR